MFSPPMCSLPFPRAGRFLAWCLGIVMGLAGCQFCYAAEFPDNALQHDLWQSVRARKLFLDDPQLAPLNLGVKVNGRVAVLWGPVPSLELAHRAEERLQTMIELAEIRNQLHVAPDNEPASAPPPAPATPRYLPDRLPPVLPGAPRPQLQLPKVLGNGVALTGIVAPQETVVRSSPLATGPDNCAAADLARPSLHFPFLGSIALPR